MQFPQDRVDHLAVVTPLPTPSQSRQQRLDLRPCRVGQFTTSHHRDMINAKASNDSQHPPILPVKPRSDQTDTRDFQQSPREAPPRTAEVVGWSGPVSCGHDVAHDQSGNRE